MKEYYKEKGQDIAKVIKVTKMIEKEKWETYLFTTKGKSMEIAGYAEAFKALMADEETPEPENKAV